MLLKIASTFVLLTLLSCGSTEKKTQTTSNLETNTISEINSSETTSTETDTEIMNLQKLKAEGYILGTIVYSDKEGDCPYTIQMRGDKMESYYLDPVNLEEKYKKDGQKVWFKFNGLRRMNRCNNASPVEITAIKKGE